MSTCETNLTLHHSAHTKTHDTGDGFYNPKMTLGRDLAVLAAATHGDNLTSSPTARPYRLLDAFSGVGALALRWAASLSTSRTTHITANDRAETCQKYIRTNITANDTTTAHPICVTGHDVNVLLSEDAVTPDQRPFDFIHLDPFGCVVPYLDSAFRCLPNGSILSFTSTDIGPLCDRRYRNVAKRHYNVELAQPRDPTHYREVAVRTVLSAVAASAARQDKGIKVLVACMVEHFILIQVEVLRGSVHADNAIDQLKRMNTGIAGKDAVVGKGQEGQWRDQKTGEKITRSRTGEEKEEEKGATPLLLEEGPLWAGALGDPSWLSQLASKVHSIGGDGSMSTLAPAAPALLLGTSKTKMLVFYKQSYISQIVSKKAKITI